MSDQININQLRVLSRIGVPATERRRRQRLLITIAMKVDSLKSAALTDDVATTVDYAVVCERVKVIAAEKTRKLIETLAEDIARVVLMEFSLVTEASVEVEKFILKNTRSVSVRVKRKLSGKDIKKRLQAGTSDMPPISGEAA